MDLLIKRKSDGEIFKVRKYVKAEEPILEEHIWSNDWYGHHIIGSDCEWANYQTSEKDLRVCEVVANASSQNEDEIREQYYCQSCGALDEMDCCCENDDEDDEPNYDDFDCTCGAWRWSKKLGKPIHIADCICGSSEPW